MRSPPSQKGKYTGVGFGRLHLARPGGLRQLMNELFLWGSFDSPLPTRARAPLLPLPSPTSAPAARSWLAAAGLCHRNAHTDTHTRAPGHHGTAAAAALCPSSLRSPPRPPLFKSSTEPFLPSFMYAVLLTEELGKHFRRASRGARDGRTQDARGRRRVGSRALFCPLSGSGGRKSLCRAGTHRRIGGA